MTGWVEAIAETQQFRAYQATIKKQQLTTELKYIRPANFVRQ